MRNLSNYIALSLLAAAFAGCSSTDTGSTSTSSNDGQDALTGPLAVYQAKIKALTNTCVYDSALKAVSVNLDEVGDSLVVISKRSVDSALLVNGATCVDSGPTTPVTALTTVIKTIAVGPESGGNLDATDQTVLLDIRNGTFATKSGATGGITIDLGTGTDEVAVLGATAADRLGCKNDVTTGDMIGLKSATSADVTLTHSVDKFTIDLNDGDDNFDQGACTTPMEIFAGAGKDTILASTDITAADIFHGGTGIDTISYAARTAAVTVAPNGTASSGDDDGLTETDTIGTDFETITGGAGDDTLAGGATTTVAYTLNGGAGDDTMSSTAACATAFNGGAGTDTVTYAARGAGPIVVDMADGRATDGVTGDTDNVGKDVENLIGTSGNDVITGNTLDNTITPGAGNDTVNGGAGDDTFVAGIAADGDDTFNGGAGTDTMSYAARTTTGVCIYMDGAATSGDCTIAVAVGAMTISAAPATGDLDTIGLDVENANGTTGADYIVGNALPNVLAGLGAGDWFEGGAGNDTIDANTAGGVCTKASVSVDCGSDALDVVTCSGATATDTMADTVLLWTPADTHCWKVQG